MPDASRFLEAQDTIPGANPDFPRCAEFGQRGSEPERLKAAHPADARSNTWTNK